MPFINFIQGYPIQRVSAMTEETSRSAVKQSLESLVQGANRCKYFNQPLKTNLKSGDILPTYVSPEEYFEATPYQPQEYEKLCLQYVSAGTQTDYRESEAQTYPWDPPFTVRQVYKQPEIISLQKFQYGNGLPATMLEIDNISRTRNNKKLRSDLKDVQDPFAQKKELIRDEVNNEWTYKLSRLHQKQHEKLRLMEQSLSEELLKFSERNDKLLKSVWTRKKIQSSRYRSKLQHKLHKENCDLERVGNLTEGKIFSKASSKKESSKFSKPSSGGKQKLVDQVDNLFSSFYLTDIDGLSEIENWLEEEQNMVLKNEIHMPKGIERKTNMQKVTEKAYRDLLVTKRTKLPPKIYHDEYDREETSLPPVVQQGFERVDLSVEPVDPVTVIQKTLRGRAHQKEVLEVIDRNKAGLSVLFSERKIENTPSSSQTSLRTKESKM